MADYKSEYRGMTMDELFTKVSSPDTTPTSGSQALVTSGGVAAGLAQKASASDVNAMAEKIPSGASSSNKLVTQADIANFITRSVNDLVNYYLKSDTYTKQEVQALIAAINQFHYEVYESLSDVTSPASNVLYLIGPTGSGSDKYEEYVYSNSTFVKIGDTSIDLSGYVTTQALNAALATKVNISDIVDNLTTDDATKVLSAKQGKALDGKVSQLGQGVNNLCKTDVPGKGIRYSDGAEIGIATGYYVTNYIDVTYIKFITYSLRNGDTTYCLIAAYDENKQYIQENTVRVTTAYAVRTGIWEKAAGTKYIRICFASAQDSYKEAYVISPYIKDKLAQHTEDIANNTQAIEGNTQAIEGNTEDIGVLQINGLKYVNLEKENCLVSIAYYINANTDKWASGQDNSSYLYKVKKGDKIKVVSNSEWGANIIILNSISNISDGTDADINKKILMTVDEEKEITIPINGFLYVLNKTSIVRWPESLQIAQSVTNPLYPVVARTNIKMVAHGGLAVNGIPFNSIDALRNAGACGFKYVETDMQMTSDGKIVIMHDVTINRAMRNASDYSEISGDVYINEKTLAELRSDYVLAADDPRMRRPIPTLEEYLLECRRFDIFPILEIKIPNMGTQTSLLTALNTCKEILGDGNFAFDSFSAQHLDFIRSRSEKTLLFYTIGGGIVGTTNVITQASRVDGYSIWMANHGWSSPNYSSELVQAHRERGVPVCVATIPIGNFNQYILDGITYAVCDNCAPNPSGFMGIVNSADVTFDDFITNGTIVNKTLHLQVGETVKCGIGNLYLGCYYIRIIAKGEFTIKAANLNVAIGTSGELKEYIFQGVVDNKTPLLIITATSATDIEFLDYDIVKFNP